MDRAIVNVLGNISSAVHHIRELINYSRRIALLIPKSYVSSIPEMYETVAKVLKIVEKYLESPPDPVDKIHFDLIKIISALRSLYASIYEHMRR